MRGTVHWNFREKLKATSGSNFQINPRHRPPAVALASNFVTAFVRSSILKNFESSLDCKTPTNEAMANVQGSLTGCHTENVRKLINS